MFLIAVTGASLIACGKTSKQISNDADMPDWLKEQGYSKVSDEDLEMATLIEHDEYEDEYYEDFSELIETVSELQEASANKNVNYNDNPEVIEKFIEIFDGTFADHTSQKYAMNELYAYFGPITNPKLDAKKYSGYKPNSFEGTFGELYVNSDKYDESAIKEMASNYDFKSIEDACDDYADYFAHISNLNLTGNEYITLEYSEVDGLSLVIIMDEEDNPETYAYLSDYMSKATDGDSVSVYEGYNQNNFYIVYEMEDMPSYTSYGDGKTSKYINEMSARISTHCEESGESVIEYFNDFHHTLSMYDCYESYDGTIYMKYN